MSDDKLRIYRIKAEKWYDNELWDCIIEIQVDEKGKVVFIEEIRD